MITISPKKMFSSAVHVGHRTAKWHPNIKKYLFGQKNKVHIFDLQKSAKYLAKLLEQIGKVISEGKTILFVSTKPQTTNLLEEIHERTSMPVVTYKWFGGLLTNFATIKTRIHQMKKIQKERQTGEIAKYTKAEEVKLIKELVKLENALNGVKDMHRLPDAIFVVDGKQDEIAVKEAKKLGIPVYGIVDSNVNPMNFDFFIPANDDASESLEHILGMVKEVIIATQGGKQEKAKT